jgi:hypothetical protein
VETGLLLEPKKEQVERVMAQHSMLFALSRDPDSDPEFPDPSDDEFVSLTEGLVISREALQRMLNTVSETHESVKQLSITVTHLNTRQTFFEDKLTELMMNRNPNSAKKSIERVLDDLDLDHDDSPTGHHIIYKVPKAAIRAEMHEISIEQDAKRWQGIRRFFKRNTIKLFDRGFMVLVTAAVMYALHRWAVLP